MCDLNSKRNKDGVNIINHSKYSCHSELYTEEIIQVFILMNNLITKLSIEKDRFENSSMYDITTIFKIKCINQL